MGLGPPYRSPKIGKRRSSRRKPVHIEVSLIEHGKVIIRKEDIIEVRPQEQPDAIMFYLTTTRLRGSCANETYEHFKARLGAK
jgi:hypothetical protein